MTKPLSLSIAAVATAAVAAALLSGCGGSGNTPAPGSGNSGPAGTSTKGGNSGSTTGASCDLAPASLVNAALGTNVAEPQAQNLSTVVVCRYSPAPGGTGAVVLRIQRGMSTATFTQSRQISDANGLPTKDLPGFEDMAYTSVLSAGRIVTNTVVALKGTDEILVSSPASFAQEQALIEQIYAKLA